MSSFSVHKLWSKSVLFQFSPEASHTLAPLACCDAHGLRNLSLGTKRTWFSLGKRWRSLVRGHKIYLERIRKWLAMFAFKRDANSVLLGESRGRDPLPLLALSPFWRRVSSCPPSRRRWLYIVRPLVHPSSMPKCVPVVDSWQVIRTLMQFISQLPIRHCNWASPLQNNVSRNQILSVKTVPDQFNVLTSSFTNDHR